MCWISVKDRLPEENMEVLTYSEKEYLVDYIIYADNVVKSYIWARELWDDNSTNVTHWMKLPKKPEE